MNVAPEHPKQIARIGSVLALLGSLIWVQWPIDFENFNIAAVVIFFGALVTWAGVELASYREGERFNDNIMSDDVDKLNSITKIIDRNQYYILRQKAIQTYMPDRDYDGIRDLSYYRENDIFPFHNKGIQTLYEKFAAEAGKFYSDFYNLYTSDGRGRSTWRESGDRYVSEEIYNEIMTKIARLNERASKLADLWEELINFSRQELKGASKTIERYEM